MFQMLYPLCALMLHYLEDEDVFACVQHLLVSKVSSNIIMLSVDLYFNN